jgi:hypothetical protein
MMGSKKKRNQDRKRQRIGGTERLFQFDDDDFPTPWGAAHAHFYVRGAELVGIRLCVPRGIPQGDAESLSDKMHETVHRFIAAGWVVGQAEVRSCACSRETVPGSLLFRGCMGPLEFSEGMADLATRGRDFCGEFGIASHIPGWPSRWG